MEVVDVENGVLEGCGEEFSFGEGGGEAGGQNLVGNKGLEVIVREVVEVGGKMLVA